MILTSTSKTLGTYAWTTCPQLLLGAEPVDHKSSALTTILSSHCTLLYKLITEIVAECVLFLFRTRQKWNMRVNMLLQRRFWRNSWQWTQKLYLTTMVWYVSVLLVYALEFCTDYVNSCTTSPRWFFFARPRGPRLTWIVGWKIGC